LIVKLTESCSKLFFCDDSGDIEQSSQSTGRTALNLTCLIVSRTRDWEGRTQPSTFGVLVRFRPKLHHEHKVSLSNDVMTGLVIQLVEHASPNLVGWIRFLDGHIEDLMVPFLALVGGSR